MDVGTKNYDEEDYCYTFTNNWPGSVGIHAQIYRTSMALSITLTSVNSGAAIGDSTILGDGRGGNAQTELFTTTETERSS